MNDGKSMHIQGDWIGNYFHFDKYGSLIPSKESLRTEEAAAKVNELFSLDRDLERDMTRRIFQTDVAFAWRPEGSTPVIAGGIKMFGPSPLQKLKFSGKIDAEATRKVKNNNAFLAQCSRRKRRIDNFIQDARNTLNTFEPKDAAEEAILEVEKEQVLTGGGYDNTDAFQITNSLLDFLVKCADELKLEDSRESEILMEQILKFREKFWKELGVSQGSIRITSFDLVRMMQESDGMIGFPVFAKAFAYYSKKIATRLSSWSGVDSRWMASSNNKIRKEYLSKLSQEKPTELKSIKFDDLQKMMEKNGDTRKLYKVVDGMTYTLDRLVVNPQSALMFALIWTLARIQRHGYKLDDNDKLESKKGKARSVSPNAALSAAEEAMVGDPFINLMKEKVIAWMPSLQDRETADQLIWDWYEKVLVPNGMRALPADWSGYDKTVKGSVLATILYYIVRPLFHFDDQKWVDLAIVSLTYKYFFINKTAAEAEINAELWEVVKQNYEIYNVGEEFYLVGTYDGLGSGAKLTHVGGSLYGELIIHHCIPAILGYEGVDGPQAGDDTSLGVPENMINLESAEKTYQPISDAAARYHLELNAGKQMWVVGGGEVMNIFLQYSYNYNLGIKGIGTAVRYYAGGPFAEREKYLKVAEQYLAMISKFNNGWTNPWIKNWIAKWFERDEYICIIFKEYGVKAFEDVLIKSIGTSFKEVSERLELTYNWGLTSEQMEKGDIPILPILAEVAAGMYPKVTLDEAMSALGFLDSVVEDAKISGGYGIGMDIDNTTPESELLEDSDD